MNTHYRSCSGVLSKILISICLVLSVSLTAKAQDNLVLSGKVIDSKTKTPLVFASVSQPGTFRGVATNQDGEFRFNFSGDRHTDSVLVSYVGYKPLYIHLSSYELTNLMVMLDPEEFEVGEIVVKSKRRSAEEIIKKALGNFNRNYIRDAHILKGFYREITYENKREVMVSEATMDILKSGYRDLGKEERVKLINSRRVQSRSRALNSGFTSEGGVYYRNEDDLVKNRPTFLLKDFLPYYEYKTIRVLGSGDQTILVIGFSPDRSTINSMEADNLGPKPLLKSTDIMYSGEIYIMQNDYSVIRVDYWLDKDKLRYAESNFITNKPEGAIIDLKKAEFRAEYRKNTDNKYVLSLSSGRLDFNIRGGGFPFGSRYEVYNEFMAYDLVTDSINKYDFSLSSDSKSTLENITYDYNPDYWENENIISARKRTTLLGNQNYEELLLYDNISKELNKGSTGEILHLHIDRQKYLQGEDVFFKAYNIDGDTGYPSDKSKSFFVYLKNEQNSIIDSSRFKLAMGSGKGSFTLKKDLPAGTYKIIAYASQMQNYGTDNVFIHRISVAERMSFIDEVEGDKIENNTDVLKPLKEAIDIYVLPEGGVLLDNALNNIGIITLNKNGDPVSSMLEIVDADNNIIDSVETNSFGIGEVTLRIQKERDYFVRLIEEGQRYSDKVAFPERNTNGLGLRLISNSCDTLKVAVESNKMVDTDAHLVLVLGKEIVKAHKFKVYNSSIQELVFDSRRGGVGSLTLFEGNTPVAERLVMINADKKLHISAKTEYLGYPEKSLVKLKIKTSDSNGYPVSANLSLSVIDSLNGRDKHIIEKNILYSYWFRNSVSKQVPANLAEYMADRLNIITDKSIENTDLFLLCYGWRKLSLKDRLSRETKEERESEIDYDAFKVKISQRDKRKTGTVPKINITSLRSLEYQALQTSRNREGIYSVPSHLMESKLVVGFDNSKKARKWEITASPVINTGYLQETSLLKKTRGEYLPAKSSLEIKDLRIDQDLIVLDEVNVKGVDGRKNRKIKIDEVIDFSNMTTSFSGTPEEHPETMGVIDLLSKIAPWRMIDRSSSKGEVFYRVVYRKSPLFGGPIREIPVIFILNDTPISKNYHDLDNITSSDIDHITVVKGPQAFFFWGQIARGGAVLVYTKDPGMGVLLPDLKFKAFKTLIPLCSVSREFITPVYDTPESLLLEDYRSTIYWNPDIITDHNGEALIEYYNTGNNSLVIGNIQGLSANGLSGFQKFRYRINRE